MSQLSLREAARATGTSRSTLLRRIQTGRLPAARTDDGVYAIDPETLLRICPPRSSEQSPERPAAKPTRESVTRGELDLHVRNSRLEAEVAALRAALETEKMRSEELRDERDRWRAQAERLTFREQTVIEPPRPVERGLKFLRWAKTEASV